MNKAKVWEHGAAPAVCACAAALMLLFASQCSPLYPINVWGDANCLLTVGRVMRHGGVVYRDIYEQKGPLLYLIHMLAAYISDTSFLGVYVMEVAALTAALYAAYGWMRTRAGSVWALSAAVIFGALTVTGGAFARGDSAEEFCLPLLIGTLAIAYAEYGRRGRPMRMKRLFVCGVLAGLIATVKYTLLGALVGLCVVEGVLALREGGLTRALKSAGVFLLGMALPILPWVLYFAANGALGDAYTAYIYNNIFLYGDTITLWERCALIAGYARQNLLWLIPTALGLIALLRDRGETRAVRLCVCAMAACQFAAVFFVGRVWAYSLMAMAPFGVVGGMQLRRVLIARAKTIRGGAKAVAAALAAALGVAWLMTPNAFLRGQKLEDLAQGRLAAQMESGATLLQYNHLDDGLYLAAHVLPEQKYFVRLNVHDDEMRSELDRYVREAIPDYVLVSWNELPAAFDRYELIAADVGYDDSNRLNKMLYLYRRKG